MDYWGVVRQAWAVSRRTRPLWWLGVISAAQLVVYTFMMTLLLIPVVALPQVFIALGAASEDAAASAAIDRGFGIASSYITAYGLPVLAGFVALMAFWIVLGVFDVAAQPGLITQTTESVEGRPTSVRAGMADGFRLWWRTVGLLVISAMPALLYVLAMGLLGLFTVSLPLLAGEMPDPIRIQVGYRLLSPLSTLVSLVSIPLGVWVALALRFAVLDDLEVRPALGAAWRVMKAEPAEVFLIYLVIAVVGMIVGIPLAIVVTLIVGGFAVAAVAVGVSGGAAAIVPVVGISLVGLLVIALVMFAFSSIWFVYTSVAWTLFWRRLTGRDPRGDRHAAAGVAEPVAATAPVAPVAPVAPAPAPPAGPPSPVPPPPASLDAPRRDDL